MPPYITGHAIGQGMQQGLAKFAGANIATEITYTFVIIACSLMIYFATKELYELSGNKGLKYFRLAFLYLALAYFFRSSIKLIITHLDISRIIDTNPQTLYFMIGHSILALFIYFTAMAIFYLLASVMQKKWNKNHIYALQALAITISIITVITKNPVIVLTINLILLAAIIITFNISKSQKNKNKKTSLHTIYTLMIAFWIINILDILIPSFFQTFQLIIYISSLSVFLAMLYKVLRKTG